VLDDDHFGRNLVVVKPVARRLRHRILHRHAKSDAKRRRQRRQRAPRGVLDLVERTGQHPQHRQIMDDVGRFAIHPKRALERCNGELVASQRAVERVPAQRIHRGGSPDDQAALRPPGDLIPAERHHIDASRHPVGDHRSFRQPASGEVNQRTGSEIFHHRDAPPPAERDEIGDVVARLEPHHQCRPVADRRLVIRGGCAVASAHLFDDGAAARNKIEHPEWAAKANRRPARKQDLLAGGQRVEHEEHRRGVVIDHGGRFRACKVHQQIGNRLLARSAIALREVVLDIERLRRCPDDGVDGQLGKQRASQVGVNQQPRGVDHALKTHAAGRSQPRFEPRQDRFGRQRLWIDRISFGDQAPELIEDVVAAGDDILPIELHQQPLRRWVREQPIHRRQLGKRLARHGPFWPSSVSAERRRPRERGFATPPFSLIASRRV
jgi:hypothetical protein